MLTSPARTVKGRVELLGSALSTTFLGTDNLASFTVSRACDNTKFFGFGICQELEAHIIDKERSCFICKNDTLHTSFGVDNNYVYNTPTFYTTDVIRDENTNALTVKASDALYKARLLTLNDIHITAPYSIRELAFNIAHYLNLSGIDISTVTDGSFDTTYEEGGNFGGEELLRAVLDDIAEATQTIYYIDSQDTLVFKRLSVTGNPVITIDKSQYFTLKAKDALTLTSLCHATELGDNLTAGSGTAGITQYIRDNAFWNLRTDVAQLLDKALAAVSGLTIQPVECEWRGNYLIELGDKIDFVTKDGVVTTYLLNDKYTYNGGLSGTTSWEMPPPQEEAATNPTNLGDKINQTFAKVDKVNQQIDLVVDTVKTVEEENTKVVNQVAQLQVTTSSVTTKVSNIETKTDNSIEALNNRVTSLAQETALKVDADEVEIIVEKSISEGVDKVVTSSKKYTFDDSGLNVSSSSSNISTNITEDGMRINRAGEEVLTADNEGVKAEDLHATTYLIIGHTSRLEDRANRTACFWIGGN